MGAMSISATRCDVSVDAKQLVKETSNTANQKDGEKRIQQTWVETQVFQDDDDGGDNQQRQTPERPDGQNKPRWKSWGGSHL